MGRSRKMMLLPLIAATIFLGGCENSRPKTPSAIRPSDGEVSARPPTRDSSREAAQVQPLPGPYRGLDSVFVHLGDTIPGFAGFYFDRSGDVVVRLVAPNRPGVSQKAQERVRARLQRERGFGGNIVVQPARYSFAQLAEWRVRLEPRVIPLSGGLMTDVDEANNRITIGVTDAEAKSAVEKAIASLSIPRDAVVIQTGLWFSPGNANSPGAARCWLTRRASQNADRQGGADVPEADGGVYEKAEVMPELLDGREIDRLMHRNYPPLLRDSGVEGEAVMEFVVMEDGCVDKSSIRVVSATHEPFGFAAGKVIERARFRPGQYRGVPVKVRFRMPVQFRPGVGFGAG